MRIIPPIFFILIFIAFNSCSNDSKPAKKPTTERQEVTKGKVTFTEKPPVDVFEQRLMTGHIPTWSKNANIYQINVRQYTNEGTFKALKEHLPRLKNMGVDILSLIPIYPISKTKSNGSLGNPYSVSDFSTVNPELGSMGEFRELIRAIHRAGMKVIIEFTPSYTGLDHQWVSEHPEYYLKDRNGSLTNPKSPSYGPEMDMSDLAALDLENQDVKQAIVNEMLPWIQKEKIDGFKIHSAALAPPDFWTFASYELRSAKLDLLLIADSCDPSLLNDKYFHGGDNWELYSLLNKVAIGSSKPKDIVNWYKKNQSKIEEGWQVNFTSNNYVNSHKGSTRQRMGAGHDALASVTYTIGGMPLIYGGQEEPLEHQLKVNEKDNIGFKKLSKSTWFSRILNLKHMNQALWNGKFGGPVEFLQVDDQILSYKREKNGNVVYCVFNLSDQPATYVMDRNLDRLNEINTRRVINFYKGADLNLQPWSYRIYTNI